MSISVRSRCVGGRARVILSVMAAVIYSALVLAGCGKDNDDDNGGDGGNLVLGDGEAWVMAGKGESCYQPDDSSPEICEPVTYYSGYIFKQNGDLVSIRKNRNDSIFFYEGGPQESKRWSTNGNTLVITSECDDEDPVVCPTFATETVSATYSVSGDTLTITYKYGGRTATLTYKRTSVGNIGTWDY